MRIVTVHDGVEIDVKTLPDDPIATNQATIRDRIPVAIQANQAYLAIPTPTAAQRNAQLDRLTRQVNALLRITAALYDSATDT